MKKKYFILAAIFLFNPLISIFDILPDFITAVLLVAAATTAATAATAKAAATAAKTAATAAPASPARTYTGERPSLSSR